MKGECGGNWQTVNVEFKKKGEENSVNFDFIISERLCSRSSRQVGNGGSGSYSDSFRCTPVMHKECQICSQIRMFLCLPTLRRLWLHCDISKAGFEGHVINSLRCTFAPSWDQWIPCSRNCFSVPSSNVRVVIEIRSICHTC